MTFNNNIPDATINKSIWLKVGTLLDGLSQPLKDAHVVYNNEELLYIGESSPPREILTKDQQKPHADLPSVTMLPGLIEAHAHLFLEGGELDFDKRKAYRAKPLEELLDLAKTRLERLVRCGVTAVRDAGDKNGVGLALSRLYERAGKPLMPYLDSPGAAIHHKGRYGGFMAEPIENYPSLKDVVRSRVIAGADRIKLITTGIINFKKGAVTQEPQMSADEIKILVTASKELDRQTFAHASGDDGIENAIDGGVDSVEHGFFIREDQLARLRDSNIAWIPTFTPVQLQVDYAEIMMWDDQVIKNLQKILDCHSRSLLKAHELGVKIIAGSDAGSYGVQHGLGFLYELELMEKSGMPPLAVINSATGVSSGRLGYKEKIGQLKAGYKARFILTENDLLQTVTHLKKDKWVVFDGVVYSGLEDMDYSGM